MTIRDSLLKAVEKVTHHPRYHPEDYELDGRIHWSNKVWVSNIFRFYEYLFGRGFGIRAESKFTNEYIDGTYFVNCELYTLEALLSHVECVTRWHLVYFYHWLTNPQFMAIMPVPRPAYVTFGLLGFIFSFKTTNTFLPFFGLAIALDVAANSTVQTTSPVTWNHTCTGSNLLLFAGFSLRATTSTPAISSASYNSVSMTEAVKKNSGGATLEVSIWFLGNPATGTNQVSGSFSGGTSPYSIVGGSVSYSGAQSSSTADAINSSTGAATGGISLNVTTIQDNCWVVGVGIAVSGAAGPDITAGNTGRWHATGTTTAYMGQDTNAAVHPAGTQTMTFTVSGSTPTYVIAAASFAPASSFTFQQLTNTQEIPRELFEKTEVVSY